MFKSLTSGVSVLFPVKFCHFFVQKKIYHIFASAKVKRSVKYAGIAQLVEHDLAKVGVASSSLVSRSLLFEVPKLGFFIDRIARMVECLPAGRQGRHVTLKA